MRYLLQDLPRTLARRLGEGTQHLGQFFDTLLIGNGLHIGDRALTRDFFPHLKVSIAKPGQLRQVSDAEHLMV